MTGFHAHADPPRTLGDRLAQLNDHLHALSIRLKDAIAQAFSNAVGDAIRAAIRNLLGRTDSPATDHSFHHEREPQAGFWHDAEESPWHEEADFLPRPQEAFEQHNKCSPGRWSNALVMAVQTALWWLRQQPGRRPVLTTTVVAVAAGVTAFLAGPALAAGVGVLASAASLFLTANLATSAGEQLRALAPG
jgi:hypothetical protein